MSAQARRRAAVIGSPVSHSLSPAIHRASFASLGVDWTYGAVECRAEEVGGFLAAAPGEGFGGLSVTMPLKEAVIAHLHEVDDDAALLRAVNCITVLDDGRLRGSNTDGRGCCDALAAVAGVDVASSRVVLLGAGGTARAVALALVTAGAEVSVVNRSDANARALVAAVSAYPAARGAARVGSPEDVNGADVLVNATSVGMNTSELPLDPALMHPGLTVLDAVYSPLRTALLEEAAKRGAGTVDGLWMLIHQARHQQQLWFGRMAPAELMRAESERELGRRPK
ncbi:MAG: shikimate dehydrogenase [Actinomycetota bacterium]